MRVNDFGDGVEMDVDAGDDSCGGIGTSFLVASVMVHGANVLIYFEAIVALCKKNSE